MKAVKTSLVEKIKENIEKNKELYISTSHKIHKNPEIGNQEFFASSLLTELLENEGFSVTKGVAGHDTAFIAKKTSNKAGPTIAF